MVADGVNRMPDQWWIAIFPALAIMLIVLGLTCSAMASAICVSG
jgi:ABC-type dipeptide/oligopeptide/nickel transport system permease subunit